MTNTSGNQTFPLSRLMRLTAQTNGLIGVLGDVMDGGAPGFVAVQINLSADFSGSFQVVGRTGTTPAFDQNIPFVQVPYRRIYVNDAVADYALTTDAVVGNALIQIPAAGLTVGLLVQITAGEAWVAPIAVAGASADVASQVALAPSTATTGKVGVDSFAVSATFTRPANTTAYTAGDVMANTATSATCLALTIPVAAYAGQKVRIDKLYVTTSQAACVAQVRTQWYSVSRANLPTATPVDNAAMTTILANDPYFKGCYDLLPLSAEAGSNTSARSQWVYPAMEITCAANDTNLYCTLTTNTAFTPDSGQTFTLFASGIRF